MDRSLREESPAVTVAGLPENHTILVAPLDWGLGHATRMVPIVRQLSLKNKVILCTTPGNDELLAAYFPGLTREAITSYAIRYSSVLPQWIRIILSFPSIWRRVRQEHRDCELLVKRHRATVTISDNRYGFYAKESRRIFITHQLRLVVPFVGWFASLLQQWYLKRFDKIWVPDYREPARRLSGRLPGNRSDVKYIGPQSALMEVKAVAHAPADVLLLLSGPEPQRSMLEATLVSLLSGKGLRIVLVRGTSSSPPPVTSGMEVVGLASGPQLRGLIEAARVVICRSGYSTLMDLHMLGKKKIVLVPTPGQPEQEYLASHWALKFGASVIGQRHLTAGLLLRIR